MKAQSNIPAGNTLSDVNPADKIQADKTIVVAMSGGVDSSAAALMLAEQGYQVIGVAMQVWDYRNNGGNAKRATCCAPADFADAREVAASKSFPFYVFDFEDSFYEKVISPFVDSYLKGFTPNPCLDCNRNVKFKELRRRARALGAEMVATGHYAKIAQHSDGKYGLYCSVDLMKDQSYFLYAMTQEDLRTTLFPVGDMLKEDVRAYLAARGLKVATKAESQDICFVSSSVGAFVEKHSKSLRGAGQFGAGQFVDTKGQVLGDHRGIHHFTVGQRKGLGLSHTNPLYVLNIDANSSQVVVGEKEELERQSFMVHQINWISGAAPQTSIDAMVKLRYRHHGVLCRIEPQGENSALLTFLNEWSAVSPGQAAVFHRLDDPNKSMEQIGETPAVEILGGGIIERRAEASV